MQNTSNADQSHILDQPIPRSLQKLQKQFKRIMVTRSMSKAFDHNLKDYSFGSGETDIQDLDIFFADVRQYIKQIVSRKLKRNTYCRMNILERPVGGHVQMAFNFLNLVI